MSDVKCVPELRFPEFSENWGFKSLEELSAEKFSNGVFNDPKKVGKGYRLINVKDMFDGDAVQVKNLTLIDLQAKEFNKNKVEYGDVFFTRSSLVADGIAVSNVCLSHDDDITFDGHLVKMRPDLNILNPVFLGLSLKTAYLRKQLIVRGKTTTMTTIGQEDIKTVNLPYPKQNEQQKIADFLSVVDKKIELLDQKVQALTDYKKGVMQQLFTQQIRFKDNQGNDYPEWELKQIGSVFEQRTEKYEEGLELLSVTMNSGVKKRSEIDAKDNSSNNKANYKKVCTGDIVYNSMRMWQGASGVSIYEGVVSPAYTVLESNKQNISEFFGYYFKTTKMIQTFQRNSQGLTSDTWNLKYKPLSKIKIMVPIREEQQKIADFLTAIDQKIQQTQTTLNQTQAFKKGLLQKMFV